MKRTNSDVSNGATKLASSLLTVVIGNVVKRESDPEADLKMFDFS